MTDLNVALILRFIDRATGPAQNALRQVERVSNRVGQAGLRNLELADRMDQASEVRRANLKGEAMAVAGMAATLFALTEPAIQAEARLAEVSKVVDFEGAHGFRLLRDEVHALIAEDGLAATSAGIMDIVAAAGRMGVVDENLPDAEKRAALIEFARDAVIMSKALGVSEGEAGETLARWRENLSLSQVEAMRLGDQVNLLGNSMATNEADILSVINRQGVLAQVSGLATEEITALSASLLAAGASPEIAGTGMKNFLNALTRGESATERQSEVWKALGIDAVETARMMQEDAGGTILNVLEALNEIDPARQSSLIGDLFGEEAKSAIAPLVSQTDMLREALGRVGDETAFLGLMEEEYSRQAATTLAQRQRMFEMINMTAVVIGSELLPMVNEALEAILPMIAAVSNWAAANPELIEQLGWIALYLFGAKAGVLALRFAFEPMIWLATSGVRAFGALQVALGLTGRALVMLSRFAMGHPLLLLISAIVLAADAIYTNWDAIVSYFKEKIDRVKAAFDEGLFQGVFKVIEEFNGITLLLDAAKGFFTYLTGWTFDDVEQALRDAFDLDLVQAGIDAITSFLEGVVQGLDSLLPSILRDFKNAWAGSLEPGSILGDRERLGAELSQIGADRSTQFRDYPGSPMFRWPDRPRPSVEVGRALGGPVRSGHVYEVNENGQELFAPGRSGTIITARDARGSGRAAAPRPVQIGDIHIHAAPGMDEKALAREVRRQLKEQTRQSTALHDGGLYE